MTRAMPNRGTGWERAVGPVGGALLAGAALVLAGGVANAIALPDRVGFYGYTPLTSNPVTGGLARVPGPPLRQRLDLVVQAANAGVALLVLAAVALAAFVALAAPRAPAAARRIAGLGSGLSWLLVVLTVSGVYDAFDPPGASASLTTGQKIATAAPRAAAFVVSAAAAWLAMRSLSRAPGSPPGSDRDPAPVDVEPS